MNGWTRVHHSLQHLLSPSFFTFCIDNLPLFQEETIVINQCNQLLSPSAEPNYVMTYLNHSFQKHREFLCAGAWILMNGHLEINHANLVCFLIMVLI